jgi:hypothetical protein
MAPKKKAAKSGKIGLIKKAKIISENATMKKAAVAQDMNTEAEPKSDPVKPSNPEAVALNVPSRMTVYSPHLHLMTLPADMFLYVLDFLVGSWIKSSHHSVYPDGPWFGAPQWFSWTGVGYSLKNFSGLAVVSKAFIPAWKLLPRHAKMQIAAHTVNSDAAARVMCNLGESLEKLDLTVRYNSAKEDFVLFASTLRGSSSPFAKVALNLYLWMLPGSSAPRNPPRLTIKCVQIRPSGTFRSLKCFNLRQLGKNGNQTRLQALTTCSAGNHFTNKMLEYMPPTLNMLRTTCSPHFNMPCDFPAHLNLTKLVLQHVNFVQPKIGRLPSSLNELVLVISSDWTEDGTHYEFPTLDITGLPPNLTTLTIAGVLEDCASNNTSKVTIIGTWPPAIKTVKLHCINIDGFLANALPAGAKLERSNVHSGQVESSNSEDVDDDASWIFLPDQSTDEPDAESEKTENMFMFTRAYNQPADDSADDGEGDDAESNSSSENQQICDYCSQVVNRHLEVLEWLEEDSMDGTMSSGYGCRDCLMFCERCMQSRKRSTVTWFEKKVDGAYSACDVCWTSADDARPSHGKGQDVCTIS